MYSWHQNFRLLTLAETSSCNRKVLASFTGEMRSIMPSIIMTACLPYRGSIKHVLKVMCFSCSFRYKIQVIHLSNNGWSILFFSSLTNTYGTHLENPRVELHFHSNGNFLSNLQVPKVTLHHLTGFIFRSTELQNNRE